MKETGMTRRIDELGRVVIPKEIREKLKLRVGTPVEIFIDGGDLVLRRYSAAAEYVSLAFRTADALAKTTGHTVVMTENEKVIAAGGRRGGGDVGRRSSLIGFFRRFSGQIPNRVSGGFHGRFHLLRQKIPCSAAKTAQNQNTRSYFAERTG